MVLTEKKVFNGKEQRVNIVHLGRSTVYKGQRGMRGSWSLQRGLFPAVKILH